MTVQNDVQPATVPASIRAELVQLRAERSVLLGERERLLGQLRAADQTVREALVAQEALAGQVKLTDELRDRLDEASEARVELDALRRERDLAREEVLRTRAERDQLRINMLNLELAVHGNGSADDRSEVEVLRKQMAEFAAQAAHLQQELDAHRATVSWKVTAPLRNVRRRQTGR